MAPNKKNKKQKKKRDVLPAMDMVVFTDLRTWEKGEMEKPAFGRWVEENKLLCFNFKLDVFAAAEYPFPEMEEVIWWPEYCVAPGSRFALDTSLHVDAPGAAYEQFQPALIRKEHARKKALGLLIQEEEGEEEEEAEESSHHDDLADAVDLVQGVSSHGPDATVAEGQGGSMQLTMEDEDLLEVAARVRKTAQQGKVHKVFFRDLRKQTVKVLEMEKEHFIDMVQREGLFCLNIAAYRLCCPEFMTKAITPSQAPQIWVPYLRKRKQECKDFVFNELVHVDELSSKYNDLMEKYLFSPGSTNLDKKENKDEWEVDEDWRRVVANRGKNETMMDLLILMMDSKFDEVIQKLDKVNDSLSLVAERVMRSNKERV